jgi:hypothetical protein
MRVIFSAAVAAAFMLSSCQQVPPPPGPLLQSNAGSVGLGRVPVGGTSKSKRVTFKLDTAATAQVSYNAQPFSGTNKREFLIAPGLQRSRPVTDRNALTVNVACKPDGLGRRTAAFAPNVVGATADPKLLPVKFSCLGVGKTVNPRGPAVKTYNGNGDNALDFGDVPIGNTVTRTVRIINRTTNTFDLRIRWILGPRSKRSGPLLPPGAGITMGPNPAPFRNPPVTIRPGQTVIVPIIFSPIQDDVYDASLEVQYDVPGTRTQTKLLYTYVIGKGIG